ncbi:nucleotide-diphospho-sugar transferase [Sanghuangporus baumii]|uniref:Nucleotide-diphospho-sugar transferase n=1 Tax=Sanghuangporus baumii TaxID=108892 RepID=A0A9Q5HRH0_SANBA|nr:nucleotide-diphospho-sugar transferase [Sanghuangporus baumii]
MSKSGSVKSSSTQARSPRRKDYFIWITAAIFVLVAIRSLLSSKPLRASPFDLDEFRQLNSLSPVTEEDYSDAGVSLVDRPELQGRAVATTLYSESFASGVLALGHSLRAVNTSARRTLLYYPDRLTIRTLCHLQRNGWELHPVAHRSDKDEQDLLLQLWTLDDVGITSVVYLDSDSLVRRNFDELWSRPFGFAAVPDVYEDERGYSLAFGTSMMLLRTSSAIHNDILDKLSVTGKTYPVGLQEFLNEYFAVQVVKLPYIYNANLAIKQRSPTFWSALTKHIRIVRYTTARPFFEEERRRASKGIWAEEME